jgi:hypothetical protein
MQGHVVCVLARNLNLYCNGLAKFRPLQKEHEISRPGNVIIFKNYRYIVESNDGRMIVMWRIKCKAGNLYARFCIVLCKYQSCLEMLHDENEDYRRNIVACCTSRRGAPFPLTAHSPDCEGSHCVCL